MPEAQSGCCRCVGLPPFLAPGGVVLEGATVSSKFTLNSPDPVWTRLDWVLESFQGREKPLSITGLAPLDVVLNKYTSKECLSLLTVQHPASEQLMTHKQAILETSLVLPHLLFVACLTPW